MEVTVLDHFGLDHEPKVFSGTPMQIEQQLRAHLMGAVGHIPFGDLYEMLRVLKAMTGLECTVTDDQSKPLVKKPRPTSILGSKHDPWVHELDIPEVPNPNL
jgi:hypothetical protein